MKRLEGKKKSIVFSQILAGKDLWIIPPELDWERIEEAHKTFDKLSGKSPTTRQADDVINERVLVRLQDKLDTCKKIKMYVDKFIAHSSTPESRSIQNYKSTAITFKRLRDAHQAIFEVANFLSIILFSEEHMALAIENPTFFNFWDKPLIENGEFDLIKNSFEKYRKETEAWQFDGFEDIWRAIEV